MTDHNPIAAAQAMQCELDAVNPADRDAELQKEAIRYKYRQQSEQLEEIGRRDSADLLDCTTSPGPIAPDSVRRNSFITTVTAVATAYGYALDTVLNPTGDRIVFHFQDGAFDPVQLPRTSAAYEDDRLTSFYMTLPRE